MQNNSQQIFRTFYFDTIRTSFGKDFIIKSSLPTPQKNSIAMD